jgi:hypothetical protein
MSPPVAGGAIEEFDTVRFGGPTQARESQATITAVVSYAVRANPDRVELILTNNGPDAIHWGLDGKVAVGTRNQLGVGQQEVFQVANDGALTGAGLFMVTPLNASALNIVEVIRVKRG